VLVARDDPPRSGGQRALYDPIVVQPFQNEPDFHVYSVSYDLKELPGRSDSLG